jgi:CheY-like chemotaxis protein
MALESLILSGDADVVRVLRPTLEKLSIEVEVCNEAKQAGEILISEKFDAVIIDCDDLKGGREVLECLRATPSNKNSVAFAILNGKKTTTQEAFQMGVNFVLQKPISSLNASRCFHAALGFMERERRRYFRHPVTMAVKVVLSDKEMKGTSTNISEGGIAILLHHALPKAATPRLQFTLPEIKTTFELETEIAWADLKGRVGLRFLNVPKSSQDLLDKWLSQQTEIPAVNENLARPKREAIQ